MMKHKNAPLAMHHQENFITLQDDKAHPPQFRKVQLPKIRKDTNKEKEAGWGFPKREN
jgi:hypothetical protein